MVHVINLSYAACVRTYSVSSGYKTGEGGIAFALEQFFNIPNCNTYSISCKIIIIAENIISHNTNPL